MAAARWASMSPASRADSMRAWKRPIISWFSASRAPVTMDWKYSGAVIRRIPRVTAAMAAHHSSPALCSCVTSHCSRHDTHVSSRVSEETVTERSSAPIGMPSSSSP